MKVRELIAKLSKVDGDNTVYLDDAEGNYRDFSGLSYDDNGAVQLYIVADDPKA